MARKNDSLALETRTKSGTAASNNIRHAGKVPGVLFGHGSPPVAVSLNAHDFDAFLHGGGKNHLLDITIDGSKKDTALVREVQRHPVSRRVLHVDLQRVSATEEITASLPIVTVGTADGVRNFGGVMDVIVHELEIKAKANAVPESIEVDVSALGLHEHITAGDVKLPDGVKLATEASTILISIESSRTEAEAVPELAAPDAAEVPVVGETEENSESA